MESLGHLLRVVAIGTSFSRHIRDATLAQLLEQGRRVSAPTFTYRQVVGIIDKKGLIGIAIGEMDKGLAVGRAVRA